MTTILITGANRGLGLEFSRQYADAGWRVHACCRKPADARELNALAARYPGLAVHALDVSDFAHIDDLAQRLADETIDVLLLNAAVYGDSAETGFGALDYRRWTETLTINTLAPVKFAEAFLPHVERSRRKLIVPITSLMGSMGDNRGGGSILYRSSKAALNSAMKSLAIDLRPRGIGVLILHPGWVKTDMGGSQAPTEPEESIAGMIRIIENFRPEDSGRFLNFKGEELPW
ncbi:SDR family oxidoreductase [Methylococcus sp. EFPC2]|uniref:SDR family oxidoreductase n=1 Tax=Methylococcus sp. EFPC2 TaxID=2812648 RepID=UPI001968696A|nr:SDR family oxidoreductase [Methylococcus sp. EFPC2]QSA98788.1 SDR family oxidoreductase [Methylococcus sp. EFPC2]